MAIRGIVGAVLFGGLSWVLLAMPAHAQPQAMPITVLNGANVAATSSDATNPALPGPLAPQPAPMVPLGPRQFLEQPVPSIGPPVGDNPLPNLPVPQSAAWAPPWTWQALPDGLMYKNYLAGNEEGRLGSQLYHDKQIGWTWDASLGGHAGIIRYGSQDPAWPEGWQLDVDGAALPRLDSTRSMVSTDFRAGFPITCRQGPWEFKFGYYHLSSHLGDIYIEDHPGIMRKAYLREQLVLGAAYRPIPDLRFYSEANWAFAEGGGSQPWEFQFGIDYSPSQPNGFYGAPFAAINSKIEEDLNYSGNVTFEAGWQWRSATGHTLRTGLEYFDGYSFQRQFYDVYQQFVGAGVWYDF
jgi:hypothetical protein